MKLVALFESSGSLLFRYRSVLPLCAAPLLIAPLLSFSYLDDSHFKTELWILGCLLVSLLGLAIRIVTVGYAAKRTSGRNTKAQVAATLNTTGIYSVMRHPLYLGNYLAMIGFILCLRQPLILLLSTCIFALYYERIMFTEEAFLSSRFGETFERWAAVTPAVIPRFRNWTRPERPFSWRRALRGEYTGIFLVVGGFAVLDAVTDSIAEKRVRFDPLWIILFAAAALTYVVLRTLKKHTSVLRSKEV